MSDSSILTNDSFRTNFLKSQANMPIGVFIVSGSHNMNDIIKSVISAKGLHHNNTRVYLVDNSGSERNRFIAKAFSIKYINAPLSDQAVYDKIAALKVDVESIIISAGEIVKKDMIPTISAHQNSASETVAAIPNVLNNQKRPNSLLRTPQTLTPRIRRSNLVVTHASEADFAEGKQLSIKKRTLLFAAKMHPLLYSAIIALVILLPVIYISVHKNNESKNMNIAANNSTKMSSNSVEQKSDASTKSANSNLVNPDKNAPQSATFTIQPGDSMSSIITNYVNDMHKSFPTLSLARLGYAQDKLMNIYGYKQLPSGQKTFVVSASDVKSAWDTANQADSWETFWADYARRAGIQW